MYYCAVTIYTIGNPLNFTLALIIDELLFPRVHLSVLSNALAMKLSRRLPSIRGYETVQTLAVMTS